MEGSNVRKLLALVVAYCIFGLALAWPATTTNNYRATAQAQTVTHLNSLANNATWCMAAIDNTTNHDMDMDYHVTVKSGTGTSAAGYVLVLGYGGTGTTYDDTVAGTEGAVTLTSPSNLHVIEQINLVADNTVYNGATFAISPAMNWTSPAAKSGICITNLTGTALNASGSAVLVDFKNFQSQ